jgi:hypothetical protein
MMRQSQVTNLMLNDRTYPWLELLVCCNLRLDLNAETLPAANMNHLPYVFLQYQGFLSALVIRLTLAIEVYVISVT